jgi:hypothetical protein
VAGQGQGLTLSPEVGSGLVLGITGIGDFDEIILIFIFYFFKYRFF